LTNRNATISVVIPLYNSGESAILAINSALNQSLPCHEIIVINDGSTDDSLLRVSSKFGNLCNVKIFSIENKGAAGARNYGILKSNSDYIAFLDSDDLWLPRKLEIQMNYLLADPELSLVGALTNMKNFLSHKALKPNPFIDISLRDLLFKNYFQTSTVVVDSYIIKSVGGFPEGRRHAEEGDLFMRIASKFKCILINEVLVDYSGGKRGFGSSGLSSNLWAMEFGELQNILNAYQRNDCGLFMFMLSTAYSLVKFARRFILNLFFGAK
jgi:glycosyltransferase involved in cell wall biosynthesis